ncbi:uncharacterized protein LOC143632325 [Bidens hawaiensis]|uniref:uncharacterized protein LOC143632325 n=1 Tax=Bidens hawaiensis TaxID=980011 RepID=UPI00404A3A3D
MVVDDSLLIIAFCKLLLESPYAKYNLLNQCIARNLLLIKNQVPIFVVEKLFRCTIKDPSATLPRYLLPIISQIYLFIDAKGEICVDVDKAFSRDKHIHILEFLWSLYLPSETLFKDHTKSRARYAIRLYSRSIKFEPHTDSQWAMKILVKTRTGQRATLKLPILNVNCNTEFVLNNLIAYEQSHDRAFVTSYVHLMCALMATIEDVERLRMAGVLVNSLKSDQEASDIFKAALTNLPHVPTFYGKQMHELEEYFKTSWIVWSWMLYSKPYLI